MKKLLALLVLLAAPAFAQINIGNGGAVNIGSGSGGGGIPYPGAGIACSTGGWSSVADARSCNELSCAHCGTQAGPASTIEGWAKGGPEPTWQTISGPLHRSMTFDFVN